MVPLTLDEIRYANNGTAFRTGLLEFDEDIEDELYEELKINRDKVIKLTDIKNILLNPTKIGLQKIIDIQTLSDFDRVRGQFQKLKFEGYKLTLDIANIIETRTRELFNSQIKSNIIIDDADIPKNNDSKIKELENQLAEMQKLVNSVLSSQQNIKESLNDEVDKSSKNKNSEKKKSPGRPPKNIDKNT